MRVIIAGPRNLNDRALVDQAVKESGFVITEVVSGKARGIDTVGEEWAKDNGVSVQPFPIFKEEWDKFGKAAGGIRNARMGKYGEALIAIDTGSNGTANMIANAKYRRLPIFLLKVDASGIVTGSEKFPI